MVIHYRVSFSALACFRFIDKKIGKTAGQADTHENLTSSLNKNCLSSNPRPYKKWLKTVLSGRKLQKLRFHHPKASRLLLLS